MVEIFASWEKERKKIVVYFMYRVLSLVVQQVACWQSLLRGRFFASEKERRNFLRSFTLSLSLSGVFEFQNSKTSETRV